MMEMDEFMDRFNAFGQTAYNTGLDVTSYYNDDDEEDDIMSADLYADGHTLTFVLNNFEYTSYCNSIDEFKKELHEQLDELVDECIFESLQRDDDDEDAEG